jgi:hypothetical protein
MGMGHEDNLFVESRRLGYDFLSKIMLSSLKWVAGTIPDKSNPIVPKAPQRLKAPHLKMSQSGPGRVTVELPGRGAFTLSLSTVNGRRVDFRDGRGAETAEFAGIRTGMYVLEWTTAQGSVRSNLVVP